jgi:hypothetical protein
LKGFERIIVVKFVNEMSTSQTHPSRNLAVPIDLGEHVALPMSR